MSLTELARKTAGIASGVVLESGSAKDGSALPTRLRVRGSTYGTLPDGVVVDFTWDAQAPPLSLGEDSRRSREELALCLFDEDRHLLCVSREPSDR